MDPDTKIYYVLFPEKLEYKGGPFKFSTAQCAYLGNRLANYFGPQTQKSSLIQTNEGVQLLTEDIRSCPSVSSMECLANLDKEIKRKERALNEWNSSLKRISKYDLSPFIVKLALFDLLIKNTNRSAGNIVWLDFNQGLLSESIHATRPEAGHSLLIENLFGFSDFYEGKALGPHSPEEILSFIKETDQSKVAMDFFEAMSPANMKEIVMESKGVSPDLKDQAIRILDEQFSVLLWIEEEVEKLS